MDESKPDEVKVDPKVLFARYEKEARAFWSGEDVQPPSHVGGWENLLLRRDPQDGAWKIVKVED